MSSHARKSAYNKLFCIGDEDQLANARFSLEMTNQVGLFDSTIGGCDAAPVQTQYSHRYDAS
jgi:hypothetical protein